MHLTLTIHKETEGWYQSETMRTVKVSNSGRHWTALKQAVPELAAVIARCSVYFLSSQTHWSTRLFPLNTEGITRVVLCSAATNKSFCFSLFNLPFGAFTFVLGFTPSNFPKASPRYFVSAIQNEVAACQSLKQYEDPYVNVHERCSFYVLLYFLHAKVPTPRKTCAYKVVYTCMQYSLLVGF